MSWLYDVIQHTGSNYPHPKAATKLSREEAIKLRDKLFGDTGDHWYIWENGRAGCAK